MSESESEEELPEIDYVRRSSRQRVENRRYAGDLLNFDVGKGSIKKKVGIFQGCWITEKITPTQSDIIFGLL